MRLYTNHERSGKQWTDGEWWWWWWWKKQLHGKIERQRRGTICMANKGRRDRSGGLGGANDSVCGRNLGGRTSSLSSTPFPTVESLAVPARWIPAVMAPFLGLFGLEVIKSAPRVLHSA